MKDKERVLHLMDLRAKMFVTFLVTMQVGTPTIMFLHRAVVTSQAMLVKILEIGEAIYMDTTTLILRTVSTLGILEISRNR